MVDLEPNLVYGTPQTLTVKYSLPGQPARSKSVTRVNAAFASWFAYAAGDPDEVAVVIEVPKSYEVTFSQPVQPLTSEGNGRRVYELMGTEDPVAAAVFVSAADDARLAKHEIEVGPTTVAIKAWPDDAKWKTFSTRTVRRGLPVIEKLTGVTTPEKRLTILESSSAYHLGYAGLYVPDERVVEVGDVLNKRVVLHELTHVWFNKDLFFERWIGEGLAEEMSNRAMAQLGGKARKPRSIRAGPSAVPLNGWIPGGPLDRERFRSDRYVYNAAFSVINQLTRDIGLNGMRKVIAAASENQISYTGDPPPETMDTVQDWRYFYDLLEDVGGATSAERLFRAHVLTTTEVSALTARTAARKQLEEFAVAGDGWTPPLEIRQAMASWSFLDATQLMGDADDLRERSHEVIATFEGADIDLSAALEEAYEGSESLTALSDVLDEYAKLGGNVVAFRDRLDAASPLARLGLIGNDVSFDEVSTALQEGDLEAVPELLAAMNASLQEASERGIKMVVGAGLLLLVLAALWLWRRAKRRRAPVVPVDEGGSPVDTAAPVESEIDLTETDPVVSAD